MTGRNPTLSFWIHYKKTLLIWFISAVCFFILFRMALLNSSTTLSSQSSTPKQIFTRSSATETSKLDILRHIYNNFSNLNMERRLKLYDKMERDLDEHGAAFLKHGETSQSLSISDIFTLKDGFVTPVLKPANPPVRANVLYLSIEFSVPIADAVKTIFNPYFDKAIWFQNSSMYHFSMFHASHHIVPIPATEKEIEAEASSVETVASRLCPLNIVLDRVVLTSTGVLLGCWQVLSGTDPVTIRARLKNVLPRAPVKQLYDAAILHTTFARLLGPPGASSTELFKMLDERQFFHELVNRLNRQIRGFKAVVSELWYVEEYDVLALALNGKMKIHKFKLACQ